MEDEVLGPCGCTDYHMADCHMGGAWLAEPAYEWDEPDPYDLLGYEEDD